MAKPVFPPSHPKFNNPGQGNAKGAKGDTNGVTVVTDADGTVFTGTDARDVIRGSKAGETLLGLGGNDVLFGRGGNDNIYGGLGADRMVGGKGNDYYFVDSISDKVVERPNGGIDTVEIELFDSNTYTLPENVENLVIRYLNASDPVITGNALDNVISSPLPYVSPVIYGMDGDDTLYATGRNGGYLDGGNGNDKLFAHIGSMTGGAGADTFFGMGRGSHSSASVPIYITDFTPAEGDRIHIYQPVAYSVDELVAAEMLRFDPATGTLVLDFDPSTRHPSAVDQTIVLMGVQALDFAYVTVGPMG